MSRLETKFPFLIIKIESKLRERIFTHRSAATEN